MTYIKKIKIGGLYQYCGRRRLFENATNERLLFIAGSYVLIETKEPFVLLEYSRNGTRFQYLSLKVLTSKGIVGWIDVNNNQEQLREYSEEPWQVLPFKDF
jgi:hypothetical protein